MHRGLEGGEREREKGEGGGLDEANDAHITVPFCVFLYYVGVLAAVV